ncbi:MAG: hypothetical protein ABIH86_01440 [Planctomycetota bacterium]
MKTTAASEQLISQPARTIKDYVTINVPGEDAVVDMISRAQSGDPADSDASKETIAGEAQRALDVIFRTSALIHSDNFITVRRRSEQDAARIMSIASDIFSKLSFGLNQDTTNDVSLLEETLNYLSEKKTEEKDNTRQVRDLYELLLKEIYKNNKLLSKKTPDRHKDIILQTSMINRRIVAGEVGIEIYYLNLKSKYAQAMEQIRKSESRTRTLKMRISELKKEINQLRIRSKDRRQITIISEWLDNSLSYLNNRRFIEANESYVKALKNFNDLKTDIQKYWLSSSANRRQMIITRAAPAILALILIVIPLYSYISKKNKLSNEGKRLFNSAMTSYEAAVKAPLSDQIALWNSAAEGFSTTLNHLVNHNIDTIKYNDSPYNIPAIRQLAADSKNNIHKTESSIKANKIVKEYQSFIYEAIEIEKSITNENIDKHPELWSRASAKYNFAAVLQSDNSDISFPNEIQPKIKAQECDNRALEAKNEIVLRNDIAQFDLLWKHVEDSEYKASVSSDLNNKKELYQNAYETINTANDLFNNKIKSIERINGRSPINKLSDILFNIRQCEKDIAIINFESQWKSAIELESTVQKLPDEKQADIWQRIAEHYDAARTLLEDNNLTLADVNDRDPSAQFNAAIEKSRFFSSHKEIAIAVQNARNALHSSQRLDDAVDALRPALKYPISESTPIHDIILDIINRYSKSQKTVYDIAATQIYIVNNENLDNLRPVELLINCKTLTVRDCVNLIDFSSIAFMKTLSDLRIDNCSKIADLSPVSNNPSLISLSIKQCNAIRDIQPVINSESIKQLSIDRCDNLIDYSKMKRMTQLKSLTIIGNNSITTSSSVSLPENLESLALDNCGSITDIQSLAKQNTLSRLSLKGCKNIADFDPIKNLANLEALSLQGCKSLTSGLVLLRLTKLKTLDLSHCDNLRDISSISTLTEITSLNLMGCELIEDVQTLVNLKYLTTLDIRRCKRVTKEQIDVIRTFLPNCRILN